MLRWYAGVALGKYHVDTHSEPAPDDATVGDDIAQYRGGQVTRRSQINPDPWRLFATFGSRGINQRVDTDEAALRIDQGAARATEMNGCIRLNVALIGRQLQSKAPDSRDDALRDRVSKAIGVADREHDITDCDVASVSERNRSEICEFRL